DEIYAQEKRILIIFDGFDHVLASDGLTRNLWDNLVFLADKPGICFVTGSRGRLRELLKHNARPSIFWEKFNPTPIVIGKFAEKELEDLLLPFKGKGICFDSAAKKELMNETGGNSLLVMGLLNQLYEQVSDNSEINGEQIVKIGKEASELYRDILSELWEECPIDTRSDIADLTKHEIPLQDIPGDRRKYLETRGFALVSKNVIKASCRIFQRYVGGKTEGVSCMKRLFNSLDGFNQNIKSLLELRVAQLPGQNNELKGYIEKAIGDLQPKPSHTIIWVRSIVMQALDIIWQRELTPDKKIPTSWINEWKATEEERYWKPYYETSQLPQELGYQCALLEKITGTEYNKRVAKYISKSSYTLISFLNSVGNFGQHQNEAVSLGYAVAACFAAVELCENLSRELK
ncbi:MAG TPA: hypothetical protein VK469_09065, partial [Candidatus Kapabacteria bacterium]|nr:hypothetical protein [Candidatus Kapabacteria bacterium]